MFRQTFLLYVFILCSQVGFSQADAVIIGSGFRHIKLDDRYCLLATDESRKININSFERLQFNRPESPSFNFGFSNTSIWFRFTVNNRSLAPASPILEIKNPNLDEIILYEISSSGDTTIYKAGDVYAYYSRPIQSNYYQFRLKLEARASNRYILNVQNSGEQFHVPITIGTNEYFIESGGLDHLMFGSYFGISIFVVLLNLFFFWVLKDKNLLFYISYVMFLGFLQLSLTGLGFQYLWPESTFIANHANPFFATASIFCLLGFIQNFLKTKVFLPGLHHFYNLLGYFLILVLISSLISNHYAYQFSVLSINIVALILNLFAIYTAAHLWKKKYKPARFFLLAFIVLMISVIVFVFKNAGLLPSSFITEYGILIGSALEVLLITLAVIDRFKQFKEDSLARLEEINLLKTEANIELERKVEERTAEIQQQKSMIEEKNEEIISSIRYARRIQEALLPSNDLLNEMLPNHFVFYQPRDIVSGDFYWVAKVVPTSREGILSQVTALAVVDCTGHGVPGAFISILGHNFLQQASVDPGVNNAAEALNFLNEKITTTLNKSIKDVEIKDGMDISLITLNAKTMEMIFSGANNPVWIITSSEGKKQLVELAPNKQAIGFYGNQVRPFTFTSYSLKKGDCIYLFTDGYADQFGGPAGKKMKYKGMREVFLSASDKPMNEQKNEIENAFLSWKGNLEQVDDVCVIGIRI